MISSIHPQNRICKLKQVTTQFKTHKFEWLVAFCAVYGNGSWLFIDYNRFFSTFLIIIFTMLLLRESQKKAIDMPNVLSASLIILPLVSAVFNYSDKVNLI